MKVDNIKDIIEKRDMIKDELRVLNDALTNIIANEEISVKEALVAGLVKLNFTAPSGFYKYLRGK